MANTIPLTLIFRVGPELAASSPDTATWYDSWVETLSAVSPESSILVVPVSAARAHQINNETHIIDSTGSRVGDINQAIAKVKTRYALLLDPTILVTPDYSDAMSKEVKGLHRIRVVVPKLVNPEGLLISAGSGLAADGHWHDRASGEDDRQQYDEFREVFCSTLSGCLIDAHWFQSGIGLDSRFGTTYADIDLTMRAVEEGWKIRFCPAARGIVSSGSPGADRIPENMTRSVAWERLAIIARYHPDRLAESFIEVSSIFASKPSPSSEEMEDRLSWIFNRFPPTANDAQSTKALIDIARLSPEKLPGAIASALDHYEPFPYQPVQPDEV